MTHIYVLFSLGITLVSTLIVYERYTYGYIVLMCSLFLLLYRFVYHVQSILKTFCICVLIGIFVCHHVQSTVYNQDKKYSSGFIYEMQNDVEIEGIIEEFPNYRFSNNQYVLRIPNSQTRILVTTQPFQKYSYLEKIKISSKITDVRSQDKKWHTYYRKLNVQYISLYPTVIEHSLSPPLGFKQKMMFKLFQSKLYIRDKALERFSSHTSALVLGMLLGEKEELSKQEKEWFRQANLSHILVVSGYNISLVLASVFTLLKSFNRYMQTISALLFVFLFVSLVGYDASVIRSALMGCIVVCSQLLRRQGSGVHTLFLAATLMILSNPFSIFDAGFHLSFLATYALLILPKFKKIPGYVTTTIAVSLFVSVYITYLSESFSFIGIIINILVLFCIPIYMFLSFIILILPNVFILFGIHILILECLTQYIFLITQLAQFVHPLIYKISPHIVVIFYALVLSVSSFVYNRYTTSEFIERQYQKFVPQKPN